MTLEVFNTNPVSAGLKVQNGARVGQIMLTGLSAALLLLCVSQAVLADSSSNAPFLPAQGSTSPSSNGDLVPYGLVVVPDGFPGHTLKPGQLLVSNFNSGVANGNLAGQGSTIVIIDPNTAQQLGVFFQGTPPIGFTNALSIAQEGFVFAGSVFTTNSNASNPMPGPLYVFNKNGNQIDTITTGTNGPWGLAVNDHGDTAQLFISNVFDGTVTRLNASFEKGVFSVVGAPTTIASGYAKNTDPAALVVGPAGLAYDRASDRLYVASEDDNEIFVIENASTTTGGGKGTLVFSDPHLEGPLGLIIAPNGDLITANADPTAFQNPAQPSEIIEFTKSGTFVREFSIDSQLGGAFAILNVSSHNVNQFAWVDDVPSTISILRLSSR